MDSTASANSVGDVYRAAGSLKKAGSSDMSDFVTDVENLVGRVGSATDPEIARLRDRIGESLKSARDAVTDGAGEAIRRGREIAGKTDDLVRVNPWQALGVAAVAGLAVGLLMGRRD